MNFPVMVESLELAAIVGLSERQVQRLASEFATGRKRPWRGSVLSVAKIKGQGGSSGMQYLVAVDSLPADLQDKYWASQTTVEEASKPIHTDGLAKKTRWFIQVFADVLATEKRSAARGAQMAGLIGSRVIDWEGNPRIITKKLAYSWLQKYERDGMAGLARKQNGSKGKSRVHFSRKFDGLLRDRGVGEDQIEVIAQSVKDYIAGLTIEGKKPKVMRVLAREKLMQLARLAGLQNVPDAKLKAACTVERNYFGRPEHRVHRRVYTHYHNRKASYDKQPRIFRENPEFPAQIYVLDVHHVNVYVSRHDGSLATPKCLAIMDLATQRVWCDLVLPEKGGGIRQEHIAYSIAGCFASETWGFCEAIIIDNGSEYKFMEVLEDALQLNNSAARNGRKNLLIHALPRNAAAKAVEAFFGHFSQQFLRGCKGYVADDRMNPELPDMGKPIAPFGTFEQFQAFFYKQLEAYEHMPQDGQLKGGSPRDALQEAFDKGWAATVIDQLELLSIITKAMPRMVRQGVVWHANQPYYAPELSHAKWANERVFLHVPRAHDFEALRVTDLHHNDICIAYRDQRFSHTDQRGAVESARRKKDYNASFAQIRHSVPNTDGTADLAAFVEREKGQKPLRANPPSGRLSVNPMARIAGSALIHSKESHEPTVVDIEEQRRKEEEHAAAVDEVFRQIKANRKSGDV